MPASHVLDVAILKSTFRRKTLTQQTKLKNDEIDKNFEVRIVAIYSDLLYSARYTPFPQKFVPQ